jgi:hypothetical protein
MVLPMLLAQDLDSRCALSDLIPSKRSMHVSNGHDKQETNNRIQCLATSFLNLYHMYASSAHKQVRK